MLKFITTYFKYKYLLYFFALIAGYPCVFYLMGWLPHYTVNYVILFLLAGAAVLIKNGYGGVPKPIAIILIIQIFFWLLYALFYGDDSYFTRVFILLTTLIILKLQLSYRDKFEFIRTYNFWLVFQTVAGSIGFVLVLMGLLEPLSQFIEMDGRPGYFYGLFTTNSVFDGFLRNAGFYDEPGNLANWGVFALLFNKLFIKNKKIEYLLLFGLISTLSLAYFMQVTLYLILFYKNQRKKVLLLIISFILFLMVLSINEGIDAAILGRLVVNEQTGSIVGDNRSELLVRCWRVFKTSPLIGVGANNLVNVVSANVGFVGANYFFNWASDGLLGVFITYIPFLFLLKLGQRKRQYRYALIIILLGNLGRPYVDTQLMYPLTLYTLLLFAYLDVKNKILIKVSKSK